MMPLMVTQTKKNGIFMTNVFSTAALLKEKKRGGIYEVVCIGGTVVRETLHTRIDKYTKKTSLTPVRSLLLHS